MKTSAVSFQTNAEVPTPTAASPNGDATPRLPKARPLAARLLAVFVGIGLFVVALGLMKSGAMALVPHLEGSALTDGAWSALGLGWLGACLLLSGSPVAASSLTLLDGGALDRSEAFAMLTGSRLGASFIVLVVGFAYASRRRAGTGRRIPLSVGVLALLMTVCAYLPGALLGWLLLNGGSLDGLHLAASPGVVAVTDVLFGWAVDALGAVLPGWGLFPAGVAVLLVAFKAFDRALPDLGADDLEHRKGAWSKRPMAMFLTGCAVALVTMSVSMAITILVPLVAKGRVRREDTLPYVAGANITTLADTLAAAVLLGNADAVRVVLAEVIGVTAWTLVLLGLFYGVLRPVLLKITAKVLDRPHRLALFLAALLAVPLALIVAL